MNFTKLILWRKQKTWNIEIKADGKSSLTKQNINKREIRCNLNINMYGNKFESKNIPQVQFLSI